MPDGKPFAFWDDTTDYGEPLHVAERHPAADDANPGTEDRPLRTIGRAAALVEPGRKVVIHGGVYRECVRPARGGEGPDRMIAFEAAPGEEVALRGSEAWTDDLARFRPCETRAFSGLAGQGITAWTGDLPDGFFVGYHPFLLNNASGVMVAYGHTWTPEEMRQYLLKRGCLYADGAPLQQVSAEDDVAVASGRFWCDTGYRRLVFRLPGDADPRSARLEVTAREQAFAPVERGLGYVRVSGLTVEHCANPVDVVHVQHGALSTGAGHHWIVEDCVVRHCNSVGLDIGTVHFRRQAQGHGQSVGHIVRRNRFAHCGVGGVCGIGAPADVLVEDNVFEHIGGFRVERSFENAGLKLHGCRRVLVRRNRFRRLSHACGIWLDYLCGFNRVTGNVFEDIDSLFGGIHIESSFDPHWVDGNVFWGIASWRAKDHPPESPLRGGHAVFVDSSDQVTVAHNLFGPSVSYAVAFHFKQADRIVAGRVGLNRRHAVLNNVFAGCAKRILFGRADENVSDGNVFDAAGDAASFCVYRPEPAAVLNLAPWREYYGFDGRSLQAGVEAGFDPATGRAAWMVPGGADPRPVPSPFDGEYPAVGPR